MIGIPPRLRPSEAAVHPLITMIAPTYLWFLRVLPISRRRSRGRAHRPHTGDRMLRTTAATIGVLTLGVPGLRAQEHSHTPGMTHQQQDSAFSALKERGGKAMRVDQDQATHRFDALPDGGRIELQAEDDDATAIAGIRQHFKEIEVAFRRGD